jgi:hypothetical protein
MLESAVHEAGAPAEPGVPTSEHKKDDSGDSGNHAGKDSGHGNAFPVEAENLSPLFAVKAAPNACGHMQKPSEVRRTVEMYQVCPRFAVAPGMVRCAGRLCANAANMRPIPPKWIYGIPMPMETAANTINTSLRTLTQATARTPLAKTKATNRTTEIAIAGVRPMPLKLAIETTMIAHARYLELQVGNIRMRYQ